MKWISWSFVSKLSPGDSSLHSNVHFFVEWYCDSVIVIVIFDLLANRLKKSAGRDSTGPKKESNRLDRPDKADRNEEDRTRTRTDMPLPFGPDGHLPLELELLDDISGRAGR